jgi:hypothetical protein
MAAEAAGARRAFELEIMMALFRQQERALADEHSRQRSALAAWLERHSVDADKQPLERMVSGATEATAGGDISSIDDSDGEYDGAQGDAVEMEEPAEQCAALPLCFDIGGDDHGGTQESADVDLAAESEYAHQKSMEVQCPMLPAHPPPARCPTIRLAQLRGSSRVPRGAQVRVCFTGFAGMTVIATQLQPHMKSGMEAPGVYYVWDPQWMMYTKQFSHSMVTHDGKLIAGVPDHGEWWSIDF